MAYRVAVDIGSTVTTAALARGDRVEVAVLGPEATMPSVVFHDGTGPVVVGEEARRRGLSEPGGVARDVVRRFGDPTPLILGGVEHSPSTLLATILGAVLRVVEAAEGGPSVSVALAHPGRWGPYRRELLGAAARAAGVEGVTTLSAPEAAVRHYAAAQPLGEGDLVAVYDLGGETFEASAVRRTDTGFELAGTPVGIDGLGGAGIDEAVLDQVTSAVGGGLDQFDPDDLVAAAEMDGLRTACRVAKETLTDTTEAFVRVVLPGARTRVRVTRGDLEAIVRVIVEPTLAVLRSVLDAAGDVQAVVLVGGASRTPVVADLVSAACGLPVVARDPGYAVALGLGRAASEGVGRPLDGRRLAEATSVVTGPRVPSAASSRPRSEAVAAESAPLAPAAPPRAQPEPPPPGSPRGSPGSPPAPDPAPAPGAPRMPPALVVLVLACVLVAIGLALSGNGLLALIPLAGAGTASFRRRRSPKGY